MRWNGMGGMKKPLFKRDGCSSLWVMYKGQFKKKISNIKISKKLNPYVQKFNVKCT